MSEPKDQAAVPSVDSIVHRPWEFACKWYGVDEIYSAINRERRFRQASDLPPVPEDVHSREFAEWLTEQYRLAMRKGAELATAEMKANPERPKCYCGEPSEIFTPDMDWCPKCKRRWYV